MKVELTPDAAQSVANALETGRFVTAEDTVRFAINRAKREELRQMRDASEAEGGSYSTDDARHYVKEQLDRRARPSGKA